ncbi:helix-turn-helix domain-containing protein [Aquisediminimonas profunda]|uniref:helix-turn-helix domain-containing protein n=1 Tax=Aquisediminimonas profunda TaxID=1550733 RepID=UPI001C62A028|nr:helix-turn-helix domain-containing protein [Aquisediminimonas profunda]
MVDSAEEEQALFPERAGDRLRAARTRAGLDLSDVASRTRIPLRHLQAIEAGDYSSFPSSTYCVGFVKAYARAVGEDEKALSQQLRIELGQDGRGYRTELQDYDDADPARIPSRTLAWTAAAVAVLLAIGYGVWRSMLLSGPDVAPAPVVATAPPPRPTAVTAPSTSSEVVLTALEPVWVRIYDASDKVLLEKEMAKGERYVVPADANNPMIRTGRAQLIAVTINGSAVPTLGPAERTLKDVGISAAALMARSAAAVETPVASTGAEPLQQAKPKPVPDKKQALEKSEAPARVAQPRPPAPAPVTTTNAAPSASETVAPSNTATPTQPQP